MSIPCGALCMISGGPFKGRIAYYDDDAPHDKAIIYLDPSFTYFSFEVSKKHLRHATEAMKQNRIGELHVRLAKLYDGGRGRLTDTTIALDAAEYALLCSTRGFCIDKPA